MYDNREKVKNLIKYLNGWAILIIAKKEIAVRNIMGTFYLIFGEI